MAPKTVKDIKAGDVFQHGINVYLAVSTSGNLRTSEADTVLWLGREENIWGKTRITPFESLINYTYLGNIDSRTIRKALIGGE